MSSGEPFFYGEFQAFLHTARSLDLGPIAYQLIQSRSGPKWTKPKTIKAIARYLAFLYLADRYPRLQLTPTQEIDQVWHCHILDTGKYAEDCQRLFGRFVHHFPYLGTQGEVDRESWHRAYALTQVLFRKHFGIEMSSEDNLVADCEPLLAGVSCGVMGCTETEQPRPKVEIGTEDALLIFTIER